MNINKKFIATKFTDFINESTSLVDNYIFDKSKLEPLIKNARKFTEKQFIEEYVDLNDITIFPENGKIVEKIKEGDETILARNVYDKDDKKQYGRYSFYKKVIADKDYSDMWKFIMDNTEDIQKEAKKLYHIYKTKKKDSFKKKDKTFTAFHASSKLFKTFKYDIHNQSAQVGADSGFFFFKNLENAKKYASALKEYNDIAYIYECTIRANNPLTLDGEKIGTNWGRVGELEQADIEGHDVVIIENADTGEGGITTEIIVFDDDNIRIDKVIEYKYKD